MKQTIIHILQGLNLNYQDIITNSKLYNKYKPLKSNVVYTLDHNNSKRRNEWKKKYQNWKKYFELVSFQMNFFSNHKGHPPPWESQGDTAPSAPHFVWLERPLKITNDIEET